MGNTFFYQIMAIGQYMELVESKFCQKPKYISKQGWIGQNKKRNFVSFHNS